LPLGIEIVAALPDVVLRISALKQPLEAIETESEMVVVKVLIYGYFINDTIIVYIEVTKTGYVVYPLA